MRMKKQIVLWCILAILGLLGGGLGKMYLKPQAQEETAPAEQEQKAELATDAFSIRFFQHAITEKASGNILVAPRMVSDMLLVLQEHAAGQTLEELRALNLQAASTPRATEPCSAMLLAVDFNLPRNDGNRGVMPLPFSENVPMALSLFNGTLANATGNVNGQLAASQMVSNRTKLLLGGTLHLSKDWEIDINPANARTAGFDNASGSMPTIHQMRTRGLYRTAQAEDGSWKAVALPFRKDRDSGSSLVYIGILPAGPARDFAAQLTPEQITAIRKALADATPQDTLVEQPRQELQILPYDMRDTLRRMGLKALFDPETADFSPITSEKIQLSAALFSASVYLAESKEQPKADAALDYAGKVISFTRPYIWLIADLETSTPIEFFGLVEEL